MTNGFQTVGQKEVCEEGYKATGEKGCKEGG